MIKSRVLVVDDEDTIRNLLRSRLEREGHDVAVAASVPEAEKIFAEGAEVGVVVTDLKMPGRDGFALMSWARAQYPRTRIIVITGHGEKEAAVQALRHGASDYLEKPFDMDVLSHSVKRCLHEHQLERENSDLVARLEARASRMEGKSEDKLWYVSKAVAMSKANEWITVLRREAMRGDAEEPTVLITGQSGTGKEGIARMIHAGSRRGKGPWVAVNCANFNEQLLESELFGHEKGAFTGAQALKRGLFELAKGGTLFLDELGEMDVKLQAKLLRVLQEKVFRRVGGTQDQNTDVRVVAATNRDLKDRVTAGHFREDLFHRLSRVVIELPTLSERREDIIPMAMQFAQRAFRSRGKAFGGFTPDAEEALTGYSWPGNVRELLNVVERMALVTEGEGAITARNLGLPAEHPPTGPRLELVKSSSFSVPESTDFASYSELKKRWTDSFEREYLVMTLQKNNGNVSAAARDAKLDRSNLLRLLRRHKISSESFRLPGTPQPVAAPATAGPAKPNTGSGTGQAAA